MTSHNSVTVFAPATVANVACGFDILGFAVGEPGDELVATLVDKPGVRITRISGDQGLLTTDSEKNAATVGVIKMLRDLNVDKGIEIQLHKKMPLGSGLGSSAASASAGVFAVNELVGKPFSRQELVAYAMEGERVACGAAHADNVAPALLGGFVAVRSYKPLDVIAIPTELDLYCLLVKPRLEVMTKHAREVMGETIYLKEHVTQTGNLAGVVAGLMGNDVSLFSRSLVDVVAEPKRAPLIPGYYAIKALMLENGAIGCFISGSGPSICGLYLDVETVKKAAEALEGEGCDIYLTKVNQEGVKVYRS